MTDPQELAERAVRRLHERDIAARTLGIEIAGVAAGYAKCTMRVRDDMLNGHGICHGGVIFTLADTTFAFACNSYNDKTVATSASIEFLAPVQSGDELTAEAGERARGRRLGVYDIEVRNQAGARIALFRGRSAKISGSVVESVAGE
jgi:acyl-CoA thioesterase